MKRKFLYIAGGCILVYIFFHWFFVPKKITEHSTNVRVSKVVQKNVAVNLQTIGTVQAYSTVEIKSMVTGPLVNTGFHEGDVVAKDQVLFSIDQRQFVAALNLAKANLARDQATLHNAELQVKRNSSLLKKGYVSKQNYDTLTANAQSAAAIVEADKATIENAQLQLEYTTIRAPIPGKTGNILLKPGSVIKANDTTALVTINQIQPIYVAFAIPQNKLASINKNLSHGPVQIKAILHNGDIEEGNLTFIDNTVDVTTGTIRMKATFPNKLQRLWPGQYVTIKLPVEQLDNALLIPSLALLAGQNGFYVYVITPDLKVQVRTVIPGPPVNDETVIEKGLQLGDQVVTEGQLRLKEGMTVSITHQKGS